MANVTGWGRGTWGQGEWSNPIPVEVTGVAGTTAHGSETVIAKALGSGDDKDGKDKDKDKS